MSFVKRNYVDGKTVITAENLNDIQDAIIQIVPDDVKQALLQIASKVAYIDEDGQDYYDALEAALYPDASLVSISAVYTQSETVYDTDSLDSLKADLVVTAHFDDSSTEVVTAYTLSGTLEVGTSTITVSYGGKTTTFNVIVSYRYSWSYSGGDLNKINGGYSGTGLAFPAFAIDTRSHKVGNRRAFYAIDGKYPLYEFTGDASQGTVVNPTAPYRYAIPIPTDATSVSVSITPSTQFTQIYKLKYTDSNGYASQGATSWTQGTNTFTFNAGEFDFIAVMAKYDSAGASYPTEPSELAITFS